MIAYLLVIIVLGLAAVVISPILFFPDVSLPADVAIAIATIGGFFHLVWSVAPLTFSTIFVILGLIVGIESKIFSYKTIKWIYNKIPGIN
jgi:hypothetical protein